LADPASHYRGRFAPSPTGPLHLGSLIAAVASYLDARSAQGTWLVRMEDLDPPREEPGAADRILAGLRTHGLHWDGEVLWQSGRHAAYADALQDLEAQGMLFRCDCSRTLLGPNGCCGGRCAPRQDSLDPQSAIRVHVAAGARIHFEDRLQGSIEEDLGEALPDFILQRRDGLYAYQLAVVVDDAFQGITHVVRGCDLLDSTPRQIYLQQRLGYPQPAYLHLPLITDAAGHKLSKQNRAPALRATEAPQNLRRALAFLRQPEPPAELTDCAAILAFATGRWAPGMLPAVHAISGEPALPPAGP